MTPAIVTRESRLVLLVERRETQSTARTPARGIDQLGCALHAIPVDQWQPLSQRGQESCRPGVQGLHGAGCAVEDMTYQRALGIYAEVMQCVRDSAHSHV